MKFTKDSLRSYIFKNRCTIAGIGPMSKTCIETSIKISNKHKFPLMLISSRRQIESKKQGGGYVENWDTFQYSNYVKKLDKEKTVILCRDHGGPWQNENDLKNNLNKSQALRKAKESYMEDIDAGFKILHIDTSVSPSNNLSKKEINNMLFELYAFCMDYAASKKKKIMIEVGTEEQNSFSSTLLQIENNLKTISIFCEKYRFPKPIFFVAQTGTKVMETKNIGSFDSPIRIKNELPSEILLPKLIQLCEKYKIMLKEHNTDYISVDSLKWHPRLNIHAANIAPEFGVTETLAILNILESNNLNDLADHFIDLSYKSLKWKKWVIDEDKLNKRKKAILAGHYVFSNQEFLSLKKTAIIKLRKKGINYNNQIKNSLEKILLKYFLNFRLIK